MANRELRTEVWLPAPRDEVFPFFADAANLEAITPPWVNFRIRTPLPIRMERGALIDYTIRVRGLGVKWRTEISVWEPPYRFVDRQIRGPYQLWHHEHTFESHNGGTWCRDHVTYRSPLGFIAHPLFVDRDVARIFEFRKRRLLEIFSGPAAAGSASAGDAVAGAAGR